MKYKLIVDSEFFMLKPDLSAGLVSCLRKLSGKGFIFETDDTSLLKDSVLGRIFKSEGINFSKIRKDSADKEFRISQKKSKGVVTVSKTSGTDNFEKAVNKILTQLRTSSQHRKTKETDIKISLSLDGRGESNINTGIGFFDHMLEQIARHANIKLHVKVNGDLHVDEHHTVEDVGITLGNALSEALGDKSGIKRYGYFIPMDDAAAVCTIDLGGRTYLNFNCKFEREKVGGFPTELTEEFFRGLAGGLKANIYIKAKAKNDHHKIEAIFKVFAKALNEASRFDQRSEGRLPSTKGLL